MMHKYLLAVWLLLWHFALKLQENGSQMVAFIIWWLKDLTKDQSVQYKGCLAPRKAQRKSYLYRDAYFVSFRLTRHGPHKLAFLEKYGNIMQGYFSCSFKVRLHHVVQLFRMKHARFLVPMKMLYLLPFLFPCPLAIIPFALKFQVFCTILYF